MSTQSQGAKMQVRGSRRRKRLPDLNIPPTEVRGQEGTSTEVAVGEILAMQLPYAPPATIDVEALDDDVIESSPRAFAEAKSNARRAHRRTSVVDLESGRTDNNRNRRRRVQANQTIINCDLYINLESSSSSNVSITSPSNLESSSSCNSQKVQVSPPPPPPPPKEPQFSCPICMGPFVEETSTKCGHIFCKACIKMAINAQPKCPTCRKRVTARDLIRVFLPATSSL